MASVIGIALERVVNDVEKGEKPISSPFPQCFHKFSI